MDRACSVLVQADVCNYFSRISWAAAFLAASGCTISEPTRAPRRTDAPPPANPPVDPAGPLPAGVYEVVERVAYDTCNPSRGLPRHVTVLKRHQQPWPVISAPLPSFGFDDRFTKRVESSPYGYSGSGMSHPKVCPGAQRTYKERMFDVTEDSFRIQVDYEVADAWDCPNPRPQPLCRTQLLYEYRLVSAACPASCDGTVPGVRDKDVPPGPVPITCACP